MLLFFFFFSSRRRHTRCGRDWSSDVCSSDLERGKNLVDDAPDQSQWMVCGHSLFEIDIGKQITCPYIRTAHRFLLLFQQHRNQIRAPMSVQRPSFFSSLLEEQPINSLLPFCYPTR